MRVRWLRKAQLDLKDVHGYISQENPQAAAKVVQEILLRGESLRDFPERGRIGGVEGTRELLLTSVPYLLPYKIVGETVQIMRVLHTSRRPFKSMV